MPKKTTSEFKKEIFNLVGNEYELNSEYINADGRQHFEIEDFYGGEEKFEKTKENDQIKNKYCKSNSIKLIRIPHWEYDNIEKILVESL